MSESNNTNEVKFIGYKELQRLYFPHIKAESIASRCSRSPESLPPFFRIPGLKGHFWLIEVVDAWFLSLQPASAQKLLNRSQFDNYDHEQPAIDEKTINRARRGRPKNSIRKNGVEL
jgi:hypothetical protein